MGFGATEMIESNTMDLKDSMQPELLKRFRDEVIYLQKMTKDEYSTLIPQIASKLPQRIAESFKHKAMENIESAVDQDLGMRYFESIITNVLIENKNSTQLNMDI